MEPTDVVTRLRKQMVVYRRFGFLLWIPAFIISYFTVNFTDSAGYNNPGNPHWFSWLMLGIGMGAIVFASWLLVDFLFFLSPEMVCRKCEKHYEVVKPWVCPHCSVRNNLNGAIIFLFGTVKPVIGPCCSCKKNPTHVRCPECCANEALTTEEVPEGERKIAFFIHGKKPVELPQPVPTEVTVIQPSFMGDNFT